MITAPKRVFPAKDVPFRVWTISDYIDVVKTPKIPPKWARKPGQAFHSQIGKVINQSYIGH